MIRKHDIFGGRPPFTIPVKPIVDSILNTKGARWKNVRSQLSPAFSALKMKLMSGSMNENVDEYIEVLAEMQKSGKPIDIFEKSQALTLKIICKSVLAMNINCLKNPNDEFLLTVREFFEFAMNPAVNIAIFFPLLATLMALINDHLTNGRMTDTIKSNLKHLIRVRKQNFRERNVDMLQLMLDAQV